MQRTGDSHEAVIYLRGTGYATVDESQTGGASCIPTEVFRRVPVCRRSREPLHCWYITVRTPGGTRTRVHISFRQLQ